MISDRKSLSGNQKILYVWMDSFVLIKCMKNVKQQSRLTARDGQWTVKQYVQKFIVNRLMLFTTYDKMC